MKSHNLALLLALSLGLPALAADGIKPVDKDFATKAAIDGMTEVKLGEVAQQRGSAAKVKTFGEHMVKDHGKASDELKSVAAKNNLKLPTAVDAEHQALIDKLSKLSGAEFDQKYLTEMITAHKKAIALLSSEVEKGESPFKDWASKTLPTIKEHLKMAQADQK